MSSFNSQSPPRQIPPRVQDRVTCPTAGTAVRLAPPGTRGKFLVQALGDNTDKVALGGEPNVYYGDDERTTDGPISAAATQNSPLFGPGQSVILEGDLSLWWVDVRVADEGVCWIRMM